MYCVMAMGLLVYVALTMLVPLRSLRKFLYFALFWGYAGMNLFVRRWVHLWVDIEAPQRTASVTICISTCLAYVLSIFILQRDWMILVLCDWAVELCLLPLQYMFFSTFAMPYCQVSMCALCNIGCMYSKLAQAPISVVFPNDNYSSPAITTNLAASMVACTCLAHASGLCCFISNQHLCRAQASQRTLKARQQYMAALSHDFGTPVAVIQMCLNALQGELPDFGINQLC